jgi:hypothetical protein
MSIFASISIEKDAETTSANVSAYTFFLIQPTLQFVQTGNERVWPTRRKALHLRDSRVGRTSVTGYNSIKQSVTDSSANLISQVCLGLVWNEAFIHFHSNPFQKQFRRSFSFHSRPTLAMFQCNAGSFGFGRLQPPIGRGAIVRIRPVVNGQRPTGFS